MDVSYRSSLKNPAVEEPIDLWLHRPLGYLLARAALPTPLSADAVTVLSMLVGIASGVAYAAPLFGAGLHPALASGLFVFSAVLDCSDGQLARMRKHSSRYGRMLDGAVDAVVQASVVPVAAVSMLVRHHPTAAGKALWAVLAVLAILSGMRHTTLYDQFKNVFVRNTDPKPSDCDDADSVTEEWNRIRAAGPVGFNTWFRFTMYKVHLDLVAQTMRWIDPNIPSRFAEMPAYTPDSAARYRSSNAALMRAWSFFGIGTHIFLFALLTYFDRLEAYVLLRLVGFNALLLGLLPLQRRASRAFFDSASRTDPRDERIAA